MIHTNGGSVYGSYNPHPLSIMHIGLIWGAYYDEYGNRRTVDVAGAPMPLQQIEA